MIGDRVILSQGLETQYFKNKTGIKKYTRIHFLRDIKYEVDESFVKRIGTIQRNAYDCGPLVVYAALQSKYL